MYDIMTVYANDSHDITRPSRSRLDIIYPAKIRIYSGNTLSLSLFQCLTSSAAQQHLHPHPHPHL